MHTMFGTNPFMFFFSKSSLKPRSMHQNFAHTKLFLHQTIWHLILADQRLGSGFQASFLTKTMQPLDCSYWKYWNFLLALVLLVSLASLTSSCMEQEKASLLHLLAGLSRDGGLAASWESHKDCCRWEGITCSPNRMVTDVSLASQGLEGSISPHLGNLTGQLRLNLSCNWLSGVLPLELVLSSSIIVLDISFNCLTGGLSELPSSTPARPLQVLNISSNLFT